MRKIFDLLPITLLFVLILATGCDKKDDFGPDPDPVFKIESDKEVEDFTIGQTKRFKVEASNIEAFEAGAPQGWQALYSDNQLFVTAPEEITESTETEGEVTVNYQGTNGTKGSSSIMVKLILPDQPDEPDTPDEPEGPQLPADGQTFRFDINVADFSSDLFFSVYPDNKDFPYWVTLTDVYEFEQANGIEAYVAEDIEYWNSFYGDLSDMCLTGDLVNASQPNLPNGAYVLIAYYYDAENGVALNPTISEYFNINASSAGGETDEPFLGLSYSLDYGREGWDNLLGIPTTGKCIVVSSPDPNTAVAGWYYGLFSQDKIDGAYSSDEAIRTSLKSNEEFHNKPLIVNVVEFNTKWVLCGFWVNAKGEEGPVERIPFTATMGESADWHFVDYEGVWTVSGTNLYGKHVSYDITFEENVYNDSFKVYGFTQTGFDRKYNAPVRVRYVDGMLEFYESSILGMDGNGNWMGFCGFIPNPDKPGAYASVNNNSIIAKAVRENNALRFMWQDVTISGYTEPFVAFSYGEMRDTYGSEYLVPYDQDLDYFIVKELTIIQKSMGSTAAPKFKMPDTSKAKLSLARLSGKYGFRK